MNFDLSKYILYLKVIVGLKICFMFYALFLEQQRGEICLSFAGGNCVKKCLTKFGPGLIIRGSQVL